MGGVVDGTPVDAATTNPAFIDANGDDTALGKISFNDQAVNAPTVSGPAMVNIQREKNAIESWLGKSPGTVYNDVPTFTESEGFTTPQNFLARLNALSRKFAKLVASGGHTHDGSDGNGAPVQAASIDGVRLRGFFLQAGLISGASGLSTDVSAQFAGKSASIGDTVEGVVVTAPNNKVILRQGSGVNYGDEFVDAFGNLVYGRLTFLAGVWTLTYYVDLSGVETAYSFASPVSIILYYQELFNPIFNSPVYSEIAIVPSDNATSDVIDATATLRGLMNATTQTLGGAKTWMGAQLFNAAVTFAANVSVQLRIFFSNVIDSTTTGSLATLPAPTTTAIKLTNASLVSIQEISGGADGRLLIAVNLTGTDLTVKNETGTVGNQIRTGTGSDFTFKNKATIILYYDSTSGYWYMVSGGSSFSLAAIGAVPNANGASYDPATGSFNLQPASNLFGGVVTTIAQSFDGAKTWLGNMVFQAIIRFDTQTNNSTTGSNADLTAPAKGVLRLTNASLVSIQRVLTMANEQVFILVNKTGATITLINDFGANGFLTGTGADMTVSNNASVLLMFDSISSRVMVVGGSGGGGGGGAASVQTISTNTVLTNSLLAPRRIVLIDATAGAVQATLPAAAANTIGTEWVFKRIDANDTNAVTIVRAGADTIDEGNTQTLPYQYSRTSIRGLSATSWGVF